MTLDELKEQKIWFLWNYALGKNGKKTKVPMSANGGITGTSDNYSNTWTDYDSAIAAKEKHGVAGIGFKIPDNMYFLDIDGRPLEDSFIQLLLERHDTYAETSPSGNGIHILGICDNDRLPLIKDETKGRITLAREFYQKNPNNHIELYFGHATNRYASFSIEKYLIDRLGKNFGRAEDKGFITRTGADEPVGILADTGGADVAFTASTLTYDDMLTLYHSTDRKYRKNAV